MQTTLVVVRPFGSHAVGDFITAADTITQILASDHAKCVVKMAPPAAAPASTAEPASKMGA
jgi:hypothetical protein